MTHTLLPWRPIFEFGDDSIELTYPVMRWSPAGRTAGRIRVSASGIPGASRYLDKYLLDLTLRYLEEDEWGAVKRFLEFAQTGESFTWIHQSGDPEMEESVTAWLDAPHVQDGIRPTRDGEILRLFTLPITISRMDEPWDMRYFEFLPFDD